ncbi:MAG: aldehyde dehydrogenase family protein, partial [Myxococcota bacterium]
MFEGRAGPDPSPPLPSLAFADALADCLPPGVVNIVHGTGPAVGEQLINHPATEA